MNLGVGGTATSGADYTSLGTTVEFAAGSSTINKIANVIDDNTVEPNETVVVTLANDAGYTVASTSSATATIVDDDTVLPVPSLNIVPSGRS